MTTHKATARAVGLLFIVASAAAIVGGSLLLPLDEPDYLTQVAANDGQIITGALIEMLLVVSVVGIAVLLFPVLKQADEGLALSYAGARILEGVLLLVASLSALAVLSLSRQPGLAGVESAGALALAVREWTYLIGSLVMFGVTALILYSLLYRANLVPAWLSLWGLAGGALIVLRGLLDLYGVELSDVVQGLSVAPIGLNEMVLAVWLIVKGFNPVADAPTGERPRVDTLAAAAPDASTGGPR